MTVSGPRWGLYHQLPAWSPLPFRALAQGAGSLWPWGNDPREGLLARVLERTRAEAGLLTDSGTSALRLALSLLRDQDRAPVALPGFSCYDVATAAVGAGVPVVLYDLDPHTLSPDLASLRAALDLGARSVVIAPLYGFPVDWRGIQRLTDQHGAVVVEDAAQAHGSSFRGKPWGTHGDLVVLSFGRGKGWTGGGGGALLARTPGWARLILEGPHPQPPGTFQELRHLVLLSAMWLLGRPSLYGLPKAFPVLGLGETTYRAPHEPEGIPRASAAAVLATRAEADAAVSGRRIIAREYVELFEAVLAPGPHFQVVEPVPGGESGYLRLPMRATGTGADLEDTLQESIRRLGAERSYPRPLAELEALRPLIEGATDPLPGAKELGDRLITLPTHARTRESQRLKLRDALAGQGPFRASPRRPSMPQNPGAG